MSPLLVALLCLPIAALGAMVGIGGGVFFVPIWLAAGSGFQAATATSLVMIAAMGISASTVYLRRHLVEPALVLAIGPSAWLLSFLSGALSGHLDERLLRIAFGIVLVPVSLLLLREAKPAPPAAGPTGGGRWRFRREREGESYTVPVPGAIGAGALAGLLSGLFGIGGGIVVVPILTLGFRIPTRVAVATSTLLLAITSAVGAAGHAVAGHVPWLAALAGAAAALIGGQIGARLTARIKPRRLRQLLALVLLVVAVWVEIQAVGI
ncbi:sulfite exporter TauE/SafE family protein, partial [bacterium]|nr:sulfite exporter TauE/SafE family protein [bacterium]